MYNNTQYVEFCTFNLTQINNKINKSDNLDGYSLGHVSYWYKYFILAVTLHIAT